MTLCERLSPAARLFWLSPFVAEFLLGNIAIDGILGLPFLAPLYGGAAVLIRETARRRGRGWPFIIALALAYAFFEEGLVTQMLFNASYPGASAPGGTGLPLIAGVNILTALAAVSLHTIWSISVPIALAESLVPGRGEVPWLRRTEYLAVAAIFAAGAVLLFWTEYQEKRFLAAPTQLGFAAALVVTLVLAGLGLPPPRPEQGGPRAPHPAVAGTVAFVLSGLLLASVDNRGWLGLTCWVLTAGALSLLTARWSQSTGWTGLHRASLAVGLLMTYAWLGFPQIPVLGTQGLIDTVGNGIFAVFAVFIAIHAIRANLCNVGARDTDS
jgi:hypothetical protein